MIRGVMRGYKRSIKLGFGESSKKKRKEIKKRRKVTQKKKRKYIRNIYKYILLIYKRKEKN